MRGESSAFRAARNSLRVSARRVRGLSFGVFEDVCALPANANRKRATSKGYFFMFIRVCFSFNIGFNSVIRQNPRKDKSFSAPFQPTRYNQTSHEQLFNQFNIHRLATHPLAKSPKFLYFATTSWLQNFPPRGCKTFLLVVAKCPSCIPESPSNHTC